MTNHTLLLVVFPLIIVGLGVFAFFRFPRGARRMTERKTIGVMQPYLFPYLGYFQLIDAVDEYVIDDVFIDCVD